MTLTIVKALEEDEDEKGTLPVPLTRLAVADHEVAIACHQGKLPVYAAHALSISANP